LFPDVFTVKRGRRRSGPGAAGHDGGPASTASAENQKKLSIKRVMTTS
jgi:hypothetical protein